MLIAFLHRVVNGGGTLEREYAIGSGQMNLYLRYGAVTLGMELKIWRDGAPERPNRHTHAGAWEQDRGQKVFAGNRLITTLCGYIYTAWIYHTVPVQCPVRIGRPAFRPQ